MNPRVKTVQVLPNYYLYLTFSSGEQKIYDCSHILDFGVFQELKNEQYFKQVYVLDGTIAWPNGQDICPDTLYLDSVLSQKNIN
ncbi:MAG: DUF2442 domain-containing protein [Cyanobacteriota bacterium]|nr:DUF2442 domain-containing protein [Cyanobacteriota bacterium]